MYGLKCQQRGLRGPVRTLLVPGLDEVQPAHRRPVVVALKVPIDGRHWRAEEEVPVRTAERAIPKEPEPELLHAWREAPAACQFLELLLDGIDRLEKGLDPPQGPPWIDHAQLVPDVVGDAVDVLQGAVDLLEPGDDLKELSPVRGIGGRPGRSKQ